MPDSKQHWLWPRACAQTVSSWVTCEGRQTLFLRTIKWRFCWRGQWVSGLSSAHSVGHGFITAERDFIGFQICITDQFLKLSLVWLMSRWDLRLLLLCAGAGKNWQEVQFSSQISLYFLLIWHTFLLNNNWGYLDQICSQAQPTWPGITV